MRVAGPALSLTAGLAQMVLVLNSQISLHQENVPGKSNKIVYLALLLYGMQKIPPNYQKHTFCSVIILLPVIVKTNRLHSIILHYNECKMFIETYYYVTNIMCAVYLCKL